LVINIEPITRQHGHKVRNADCSAYGMDTCPLCIMFITLLFQEHKDMWKSFTYLKENWHTQHALYFLRSHLIVLNAQLNCKENCKK